MALQHHAGQKPAVPPPPPTWGEVTPEGEYAEVIRFVLVDRMVAFPCSELKRWEHVAGEPETLAISIGREQIIIEGAELAAIRVALDLRRLGELRVNHERSRTRPGPRVRRISIETT